MKTKRYCFGMITTFVMAATILFVDKAAGAVCDQVPIDPKDCRSWSDWVNITRACGPVETCVRVDTGPTKVNKGKPIVRVANSVTVSNCNQSETLNVSKTLSFSYNTPTVSYSICSDLSAGDKETIQAGLQASAGVNLPGSSIEDSMTVDGYTVDGYHKRTFSVIVTEYVGQKMAI